MKIILFIEISLPFVDKDPITNMAGLAALLTYSLSISLDVLILLIWISPRKWNCICISYHFFTAMWQVFGIHSEERQKMFTLHTASSMDADDAVM